MEDFLAHERTFTLCIGIILGFITWDLAFETRVFKTAQDIAMLRSYYKGLYQARFPISLILPTSIFIVLFHLTYLGFQTGETIYWWSLGLIGFAVSIIGVLAVPREVKLWKKMATPNENDEESIQMMASIVRVIRNVHLLIFLILVAVVYLTRS